MSATNIPAQARKAMAIEPMIAAAWYKYLAQNGKPKTTPPVPSVWKSFVDWARERDLDVDAYTQTDTADTTDDIDDIDDTPTADDGDDTPTADDGDDNSDDDESDDGESDDDESDDDESDDGESDDDESDDDESDDGESDDDESDDGESDDGESDDGESDDGESDDGESDDGESDDGESDDDDSEPMLESIIRRIARQEVVKHEVSFPHGSDDSQDETPNAPNPSPAKTRPKVDVKGFIKPYWYQQVYDLVACGQPTLISGPAGSGKTFTIRQLARELGLPFYHISFSGGIDESHIMGMQLPDADGKFVYVPTSFINACEQGGLILADEIDAGDPNVLLSLCSAIDPGFFSIPQRYDKPFVEVHPDTRFIGAANTLGHGADRHYVGRSRLDFATLSRFEDGQVVIDFDEILERTIYNAAICKFGQRLRKRCRDLPYAERDVSTRNIMANSRKFEAGYTVEQSWYSYFADWEKDELAAVDVQLDHGNLEAHMM